MVCDHWLKVDFQNDTVLGAPDWDEVKTATGIEFGQLLPSKQDLRRLIQACEDDIDTEAGAYADSTKTDSVALAGIPTVALNKRNSAPSTAALGLVSMRARNTSGKRNSIRAEKLEDIMHENHVCSVHERRRQSLHSIPSLERESLAMMKSEGDKKEIEAERRIRSTKSADLDKLRGGAGAGINDDGLSSAAEVLDPERALLGNLRDPNRSMNGVDVDAAPVATGAMLHF